MKNQAGKAVALIFVMTVMGGNTQLRAATIDLGLQMISDNRLTDSAGLDLGAGAIFIGNWKDSVTDYSAVLASAVAAAGTMPDPVAALGGELAAYFTIGISDSWSGLQLGGPDSLYVRTINDDTGLAARFIDAVFFNTGATEYGSLRWNSVWPGPDDLGRAADIALVVPSVDPDAAPSVLVGFLADNLDGTGKFQTIPEPTSGALLAGLASLLCVVRNFQRKS